MTKLAVVVVGVLVLAPVVFGQTQERPDYSGAWTLVEDRSPVTSPTDPRTFGKAFKLTQSPTTLSIETTTTAVPPGGAAREMKVSTDYILDGAEHQEVRKMGNMTAIGSGLNYRAIWMTGQLIIIKQTRVPSQNDALASVSRLALALDADGSLIVDNLVVSTLPRANGPKQEPPVSVRSVYKKAQ
jgi:hypothetical protein